MKRCTILFAAMLAVWLWGIGAVSEAATARLSVQITLYDLEQDAGAALSGRQSGADGHRAEGQAVHRFDGAGKVRAGV